jgi:hypothetical protein
LRAPAGNGNPVMPGQGEDGVLLAGVDIGGTFTDLHLLRERGSGRNSIGRAREGDGLIYWCRSADLNRGPTDYESV